MFIALISLIIFICVLLVLVVLAQNPKGGGLSSQFGGAGTSQLMGVKRTGDLLEKMTWGLAIALMVLTLTSHAMQGGDDQATEMRTLKPQNVPAATQPQQEAIPAMPDTEDPNNAAIPDPANVPDMPQTDQEAE